MMRKAISIPNLFRVLIMNGCRILSNAFLGSNVTTKMIKWFFLILHFINMVYYIDFQGLTQLCIPGTNPTWSWCINSLYISLIPWVNVKDFCVPVPEGYRSVVLFSCDGFVWHRYESAVVLQRKVGGGPSVLIFWESFLRINIISLLNIW